MARQLKNSLEQAHYQCQDCHKNHNVTYTVGEFARISGNRPVPGQACVQTIGELQRVKTLTKPGVWFDASLWQLTPLLDDGWRFHQGQVGQSPETPPSSARRDHGSGGPGSLLLLAGQPGAYGRRRVIIIVVEEFGHRKTKSAHPHWKLLRFDYFDDGVSGQGIDDGDGLLMGSIHLVQDAAQRTPAIGAVDPGINLIFRL